MKERNKIVSKFKNVTFSTINFGISCMAQLMKHSNNQNLEIYLGPFCTFSIYPIIFNILGGSKTQIYQKCPRIDKGVLRTQPTLNSINSSCKVCLSSNFFSATRRPPSRHSPHLVFNFYIVVPNSLASSYEAVQCERRQENH